MQDDEECPGRASANRDLLKANDHVAAWTYEVVAGRLYCGPPPRRRLDAYYLTQTLGITHVVNMLHEDNVDDEDKHYSRHWARFTHPPEVVRSLRMPAPDALKSMRNPMATVLYDGARDTVVPLLRASVHNVIYVHHQDGHDEEAAVALLAWAQWAPRDFPSADLNGWLTDHHYEMMLNDPLKRTLLMEAIQKRKSGDGGGGGSMERFVTKKPRRSNE